jgi:uncharacterized protein (TIGR00255 family)
MTGFGTAEGAVGAERLRVEVRSVNHRHLQVQWKLPYELQGLEQELRERVRGRLERGHVSGAAQWVSDGARSSSVRLDTQRARDTLAAVRELKKLLKLKGDVDLASLARMPGVLTMSDDVAAQAPAVDMAAVGQLVDAALAGLGEMRRKEGAALAKDLRDRLDAIEGDLSRVRDRAPARVVAERDRLRAAVTELLDGRQPDPDRLAQEIALLAERLDINEEIVRLTTHLTHARDALGAPRAVGRELSFLGQEMLREINTIGSKANDGEITRAVIAMKGELEKYREQVENVE